MSTSMTQWVYIYEDSLGQLAIALTMDIRQSLSVLTPFSKQICYLRPFNVPLDALAHKHLLDDLSYVSLKHLIRKNKYQTACWLDMIGHL